MRPKPNPSYQREGWRINRLEEAVASTMHSHIPVNVMNVITNPEWKGGDLVMLDDVMGRPSVSVISKNSMWIKAFVQHNPDKVLD